MRYAVDPPLADLLAAARAWAADDPDPVTRAELETLVGAADAGDAAARAELADAIVGHARVRHGRAARTTSAGAPTG